MQTQQTRTELGCRDGDAPETDDELYAAIDGAGRRLGTAVNRTAARRPVRPTTPADLWRLAEQGRQNGVRLLSEGLSGERFATSCSEPGVIHRLTAYSCTCRGFTYHGRCQHHALLLAELGWLPDVEDPEPPSTPGGYPAAPARRRPFGLSAEELVVLRGQAARLHGERGEPLVDDETGELLDPGAYGYAA